MLGGGDVHQHWLELGSRRDAWSYQVHLAGGKTLDGEEDEEENEAEDGEGFGSAKLCGCIRQVVRSWNRARLVAQGRKVVWK